MKTNGRDDEMARRTAEWSLVNSSVITPGSSWTCSLDFFAFYMIIISMALATGLVWLPAGSFLIAHVVSHLGMRGNSSANQSLMWRVIV